MADPPPDSSDRSREKTKPGSARDAFIDDLMGTPREKPQKKADRYVPGYEFPGGGGEKWSILAVDKAQDVYVLRDKKSSSENRTFTFTPEKQAKFKVVTAGDTTYYCDPKNGEVYTKGTKPNEFVHRDDLSCNSREEVRAERSFGQMFARDAITDPNFKNEKVETKIGDSKVSVETRGPDDRIVEINGKQYKFSTETGSWFVFQSPGFRDEHNGKFPHCDSKVHVTTTDAADLGRVQAALIPELVKAGQPGGALYGKIADFKTHDPMYGVTEGWEARTVQPSDGGEPFQPGNKGQRAKGFTIYATTPEAAREIQQYVDKLLKDKGLTLPADKANTGNVGDKTLLSEGSNRVSFEKAKFDLGKAGHRNGALLTDVLEKSVIDFAEKRVRDKARGWEAFSKPADLYQNGLLKPEALKLLNNEFGMDGSTATLAYDTSRTYEPGKGKLVLCAGYTSEPSGSDKYYLDESKAQKTIERDGSGKVTKGLTGRPAMYEMGSVLQKELGMKENPAVLENGATVEKVEKKQGSGPAPAVQEVPEGGKETTGRRKTSSRNRGPADKPEVATDRGEIRSQGDVTIVVDKVPSAEVLAVLEKWKGSDKVLERDLMKAINKMPAGEERKTLENQVAQLSKMEEGATKDGIKRAMAEMIVESRKPNFDWGAARARFLKAAGAAGCVIAIGMLVQVLMQNEGTSYSYRSAPATPDFSK